MASNSSTGENRQNKRPRKQRDFLQGATRESPFDVDEDDEMAPSHKKARLNEWEEKDDTNDGDYDATSTKPKVTATRTRAKPVPAYMRMNTENLRKEVKRYQDMAENFKKQVSDVKGKRTKDRKELNEQKTQRIAFKKKAKELDIEILDLRIELREQKAEYEATIEEQREDFENTQRDLNAKIQSQSYPSLPDDFIQQKFKIMLSKCRNWSQKWHLPDNDAAWSDEIINYLSQVISFGASSLDHQLSKHIVGMGAQGKRLLTYASVSQSVLYLFFKNPFVLFRALDEDPSFAEKMQTIYEMFRKNDKARAFSWRAETMRLLQTQIDADIVQKATDELRDGTLGMYCAREAHEYFHKPEGLLRHVSEEEAAKRHKQLTDILIECAKLALELFSRKADTKLLGPNALRKSPFKNGSDVYETHRSMQLEEGDRSLDGQAIQAVITPGIQVFGHAGGDNLKGRKFLSKAVVLIIHDSTTVGSQNDIAAEITSPGSVPSGALSQRAIEAAKGNQANQEQQTTSRESSERFRTKVEVLVPPTDTRRDLMQETSQLGEATADGFTGKVSPTADQKEEKEKERQKGRPPEDIRVESLASDTGRRRRSSTETTETVVIDDSDEDTIMVKKECDD